MRSPRYAAALLAPALAVLLAAGASAGASTGASAEGPREARGDRLETVAAGGDQRPLHSSDGVVGPTAAPVPRSERGQVERTRRAAWQVAPGVRARVFDQTDPRGQIRAYLLSADLSTPGLRLDYARSGRVSHLATTSDILAEDKAIAGVNADFFDIGRTGAPLGTGLDRDRGLLHARTAGWNESFYLGGQGRPRIGTLPMRATIAHHRAIEVTNLNSPFVYPGSVGLYTSAWGATPGYLATQDQHRDVRAVRVRGGEVVSNRTTLPQRGRVRGLLLVGRGPGAQSLARLDVGAPITVRRALAGDPRMAITGNMVLVRKGEPLPLDDRELHPRTAIGIDRDTGRVLMLAVDGRQDFSRGYTMLELARLMVDLGAESALNLDGGGSTTMVAARRHGHVGVINSPSDGAQRDVADAVELTYREP